MGEVTPIKLKLNPSSVPQPWSFPKETSVFYSSLKLAFIIMKAAGLLPFISKAEQMRFTFNLNVVMPLTVEGRGRKSVKHLIYVCSK